ncbi:MAG: hypothetical protein J7K11_00240 [Candidatus Hydrothermae bacterium]|nr:hypothetical protein [Candidatus Hydrothermae bacterium]
MKMRAVCRGESTGRGIDIWQEVCDGVDRSDMDGNMLGCVKLNKGGCRRCIKKLQ